MLKRWAAVTICLLAIWAVSLERTYAWLGLQSAYVEHWQSLGLHPLGFDFTSNARGDVRWQLISQDGFGATIQAEPDGLHVQPVQSDFELRLNLGGARLIPAQVNALLLEVRAQPQSPNGALPKFSLAVHADVDDPGWIAELPKLDLAGDPSMSHQAKSNHAINLNNLEFKREPGRLSVACWTELPTLTHLRLYGNSPDKGAFTLATVAFKASQKIATAELTGLRPEALLQAFDAARLGASSAVAAVAVTAYRGPWLAPIVQMWISVVCLSLGFVLLGFEFASELPKRRACARALLVPAIFLPILTMLWGNVDWPVDIQAALFDTGRAAKAALAPQWFVLMLGLGLAIGYRCIRTPPRSTRFKFDAEAKSAWVSCAVPTGAAALVLILAFTAVPGRLAFAPQHFGLMLALKYLAFAAFQQWLLQTLVWTNLRRAALARWAAVKLSALLFALLHTPNFMLMLLCFAGALFWCGHYAKYRRLLPLILSHAFLGFLCVSVIPKSVLRSADIGVSYFLK